MYRNGMDPAALMALRSFGGNPMDQLVGLSVRRAAPPSAPTRDVERDDAYLEQLDEAPEDMLSPMERVEVLERRRLPEGTQWKRAPGQLLEDEMMYRGVPTPVDDVILPHQRTIAPISQLAPGQSPLGRIRPDIAPPRAPYPDAGMPHPEPDEDDRGGQRDYDADDPRRMRRVYR